jgi:exosome complex RNA-binding protein Rrp42 (RNase PH superfamily)
MQLGRHVALAPTREEAAAAAATLMVAVDWRGRICGVSKAAGGGLISLAGVEAVLSAVQRKGRDLAAGFGA